MSVVGIDFGNLNCTIAAAQKGGVDVLLNETSSRQTPAMVAFGEKERFLGEGANAQFMRNIKNTITDVKRLIGHKWGEQEVQDEIKNLPFKAVEMPNHDVGVEVMYGGEIRRFSLVAIVSMLLQKLKLTAETALSGRQCRDVVISVPGYWTDQQRRALQNAAGIANLNCLRIINDNTATALSYGIYKTNLSETEPIYVLFLDMGQTNTSVSVVEFLKGKLRVISAAYDRNLGGRSFDQLLVDHFVHEFKARFKIDIKTNARALIRLQLACEKVKKILNTNPEVPINVDSIMEDKDVHGSITKDKFEELAKPLVAKVLEPVKQAIADSGIPIEKLFAIEIVGGASRLAVVKAGLAEFFKRDISQTLNAEEAVAKGCALQCAMLSPLFRVREFSITDITSYPIRAVWKTAGVDAMNTDDKLDLFPKNNVVPSTKLLTFHRTEPIEVTIEYSQPSLLPPGSNLVLDKFVITDIPHKEGETAKIKVKVKLDINGILVVESAQAIETIEEVAEKPKEGEPMEQEPTSQEKPKEGQETESPKEGASQNGDSKKEETKKEEAKKEEPKKQKVKRIDLKISETNSGLTEKELMTLCEEEAKMVASDRLAIETAEQKNAVESYVYDMRNKLNESLAPYSTEQLKEQFSKLLEETESWLYGEGEDVAKNVYSHKLKELKSLGDPIVRRKTEDENRYESILQIRSAIQSQRLLAESEDPKYEHIEKSEKQKVIDECKKVEAWLVAEMSKQDKLAKHMDPIITIADINKKKTELEKFVTPIMNKPKPKPEPKKEEPKPEEKKEESKPTDPQQGAEAKEAPKPNSPPKSEPNVEMDLD